MGLEGWGDGSVGVPPDTKPEDLSLVTMAHAVEERTILTHVHAHGMLAPK